MKLRNIIVSALLLAAITQPAAAQHYVGIKGGYGSSDVRLYPAWKTPVELGMLSGGLVWRYYSPENPSQPALRYTGGISMELQYLQRGYKYESLSNENHTYSRRINTLMVPLIWQPHISFAQERLRLFLNLGVTFNYNINSTYHTYVTETGETVEQGDYEMLLIRDNRWGYGLCGGLGAEMKVAGRVSLFVEGRYDFGCRISKMPAPMSITNGILIRIIYVMVRLVCIPITDATTRVTATIPGTSGLPE